MRSAGRTLLIAAIVTIAAGPTFAAGKPGYPDTISWSGRSWRVKSSQSRVGPGPNWFSASPENVWVDAQGLHLKITLRNGRWTCAEVIGAQSLGYGTYTFQIASPVGALDPNVVLGLFTWSDKAAYSHRELDVEFTRWGDATDPTNAQYVVQPYDRAGHLHRLAQPALAAPTTHRLTWRPGRVDFSSVGPDGWSHAWAYSGADVPKPGGENARLNLWLFGGSAPIDGREVEVVVTSFGFSP